MKLACTYSHRGAAELLDAKGLRSEILAALAAPNVIVSGHSTREIKDHVEAALVKRGWAGPVSVEETCGLKVNHAKSDVVLQVQTANLARAYYDLMKMQAMFDASRAVCGVLIVPTAAASRVMGEGLTQFERIQRELEAVFFAQVTIPVYLIAFEGDKNAL